MATATEAVAFSNISATTAAFSLRGGRYVFTVNANFGAGSVTLQTLGGDGSTWMNVSNQTTNASVSVDLYSGQYRAAVVTATAVYVTIGCVPT